MKRRVVVTGIGAVTSLSLKVDDLWRRLLARRERHSRDPAVRHQPTSRSASAATSTIGQPTGYISPKDEKRIDRFAQFALVAGIDAVNDSGIDFSKEDPFRCGVILGSGIGGLTEIEEQLARLVLKGPDRVSAFTIPKLMVNAASGHVSIQYGLRGINTAVATACASATNAMGDALTPIQYDDADVMITGGTEAAITPMGLAGFSNMRALSERNDAPQKASRPFDADRDGFVLSEGAGISCSKNWSTPRSAAQRSTPKSSATAPAPTAGTSRSPTKKARARRGHGVSYPRCRDRSNQPSTTSMPTARARRWATQPKRTPSSASSAITPKSSAFRSTKSQLGHLLGASGGVELIICMLALRRRIDSADDQSRHARSGVRSGLHAQRILASVALTQS